MSIDRWQSIDLDDHVNQSSVDQDIDHGLIKGFDLHLIMDALGTHDSRNYS